MYKEMRKQKQQEYVEELRERSTIVFGYTLLPIYILLNSLIAGMAFLLYLIARSGDTMIIEFANDPMGVTGDMAFIAIFTFVFWLSFGLSGIYLYKKAVKLMKANPEKYKNLKIWRW